ncbi:MAG: RraA family protein [Oscillospiraceae bacterium]|nr:RraA family protein [Oscillospiraceae bacterium]
MMAVGCKIRKNFIRPDRKLVEAFQGIPVANIDDCMGRMASVDAGLIPMNSSPLLGTAFTVRCPAGDNLMFHKALDLAKPGDVLVIAAGGSMSRALCGEIMATYAKSRGLAGFIIDGCVRDRDELAAFTDFPVYARGIIPNGPYKNGPGEINFPVSVGNQVICPGDILIGDGDSFLVIKPEDAEALAHQAAAVHKKEEGQLADIRSGKGFPRPFVDQILEQIGVEYVD